MNIDRIYIEIEGLAKKEFQLLKQASLHGQTDELLIELKEVDKRLEFLEDCLSRYGHDDYYEYEND